MSFMHYEARVKLAEDVWAAFPQVQIFLSQDGEELRIVIVPADERVLLPGMIQARPEVIFVHCCLIDWGTNSIQVGGAERSRQPSGSY